MLSNLITRIVGAIWRFGWNFRCDYCGTFKPFKNIAGGHYKCKQLEDQTWNEYLHLQDTLDDFCDHYGCWGELGYCQTHDVCSDCNKFLHHCRGECQLKEPEPINDDDYEEPESVNDGDYEDVEICRCGEPVGVLCVCPELASLARHNADPETRGSWWVA